MNTQPIQRILIPSRAITKPSRETLPTGNNHPGRLTLLHRDELGRITTKLGSRTLGILSQAARGSFLQVRFCESGAVGRFVLLAGIDVSV